MIKPSHILIFALVFIAGCSCSRGGAYQVPIINIHEGSDGISLEFVGGFPPEQIREGQSFRIPVEIKNQGAWPSKEIKLLIGGFNPKYSDIEASVVGPDSAEWVKDKNLVRFHQLDGKTYDNMRGSQDIILYEVTNKGVPSGSLYEENYFVKACYGYFTQASFDVCIDPKYADFERHDEPSCKIKESIKLGTQGGPIAVSRVEEEIRDLGDETWVAFKIYIDNVQQGQPYYVDTYSDECDVKAEPRKEDLNRLQVSAYMVKIQEGNVVGNKADVEPLLCSNGEVDFNDYGKVKHDYTDFYIGKDAKVICVKRLDKESGAYVTPLRIDVKYGYIETIKATVKIEPTNKGVDKTKVEDFFDDLRDEMKEERKTEEPSSSS